MDISICNWDTARFLIFSDNVYDPIVYYSHLIAFVFPLLLGIFIFFKDRKTLVNKLLLFIIALFLIYIFTDLILWATEKIEYVMFFWSLQVLISTVIYALAFYATHVFITKEDISFNKKIVIGLLLAPLIILLSTKFTLSYFDFINCDRDAAEGIVVLYEYILESFFAIWVLFTATKSCFRLEKKNRLQIMVFALGVILFLLAFSWSNLISSLTGNWETDQYGLFGMPVFIGFLTYLIIRHNAFNIKLLGVEALVVMLVILIGSQYAFIQNPTDRILNGITLGLSVIFGYMLIRSVRKEVKEREQLAVLTHELEHANQELKELDKVKSEFISIVSHQLRTPLTVTKGYVSMILEGVYGAVSYKIKDPLQKVYISNEGLIALVNNLLDLSRMEAGTIKYDFADADLVKMVDEIVMELELEAKHRNLYLKWTKPQEKLPLIKADAIKLKQVIEILIENSLKYTQNGGAEVLLAKENNSIIFKVQDTGIGIDSHEIEHLFNKFGRGKGGSKVNATGVGLGLYAAKQIVLKHNGDIWAESDGVGKGSTFCVGLPFIIEQDKSLAGLRSGEGR